MEKGSVRGKRLKVNIYGDYWLFFRIGFSISLSFIFSFVNEIFIGLFEVDIILNSCCFLGIKVLKRKGKVMIYQNLFGDIEEFGRRFEVLRSEGLFNREIGKEYC